MKAWIQDKQAGCLKALDRSVSRGLSRDEQFGKLEHIFADVLRRHPPHGERSGVARGDL